MISFVVPAHNEEACIGRTLKAIHASARDVVQPYEIIVADDASTDDTGMIARELGAKVVRVNHRQIAATRNAGARAAVGERIFFVDADTTINARAVRSALRQMDRGAVGGGAPTWVEGPVPIYARIVAGLLCVTGPLSGFTGGAFMFCTREGFVATGGFSERFFWGEEGTLTLALKREGRFVVIWQPVLTSGRRFRTISGMELVAGIFRLVISPVKMVTQRKSVERIWYDSNRADDDKPRGSWAVRISNGIALLLLLALISGPLWKLVPHSVTPITSGLGKMRMVVGFIISHVGLVLVPITVVLAVNIVRQKRWAGSIQSAVVMAVCAWQAWKCMRAAAWHWTLVWEWFEPMLR